MLLRSAFGSVLVLLTASLAGCSGADSAALLAAPDASGNPSSLPDAGSPSTNDAPTPPGNPDGSTADGASGVDASADSTPPHDATSPDDSAIHDSAPPPPDVCIKATCASAGAACGSISDDCGGTLDCGTCASPATCGGAGVPNQCGCVPTTCAAEGANCGTISDGCGGTLTCGLCSSGQTCGGAGPNQCGVCVTAVSAGNNHTCAIKGDKTVWCWGDNTWGEVGNGTSNNVETLPQQVTSLTDIVQITAGVGYTCALSFDNTMWCWGDGEDGNFGIGTGTISSEPIEVPGLATPNGIQANLQTCTTQSDSTLWCWGFNTLGGVGIGSSQDYIDSPSQVTALGNQVTFVAAGGVHTCAATRSYDLYCWGDNADGELGDGTTTSETSPVLVPSLAGNAVDVSAGGAHACAMTKNGLLECWGLNSDGQVGNGGDHGRLYADDHRRFGRGPRRGRRLSHVRARRVGQPLLLGEQPKRPDRCWLDDERPHADRG